MLFNNFVKNIIKTETYTKVKVFIEIKKNKWKICEIIIIINKFDYR